MKCGLNITDFKVFDKILSQAEINVEINNNIIEDIDSIYVHKTNITIYDAQK